MNFLDIIKKFNMNNISNYYEITNKNKTLQIMSSYVHESFVILTLEYYEVIIVNINDLEELILAFLNNNITKIYNYKKYYAVTTYKEFNFCLSSQYTDDCYISFNINMKNLFFNDPMLVEKNNGFFKLLNTDIYIFTAFRYIFDSKNWNIVSLYKKLDNYLFNKYKYKLQFKNYEDKIILEDNLEQYISSYIGSSQLTDNSTLFKSLIVRINFSKEQFNNIVLRLKNEAAFDILNINQFRKDNHE